MRRCGCRTLDPGVDPVARESALAPAGTLLLGLRTADGLEISTRTVDLGVGEEKEIVFRDGD